jgi:hypothetical protein
MSPLFLALIPVPFAALLVFVVWRVLRAVPRYANDSGYSVPSLPLPTA